MQWYMLLAISCIFGILKPEIITVLGLGTDECLVSMISDKGIVSSRQQVEHGNLPMALHPHTFPSAE
jgi:hypothetical protein